MSEYGMLRLPDLSSLREDNERLRALLEATITHLQQLEALYLDQMQRMGAGKRGELGERNKALLSMIVEYMNPDDDTEAQS
jgi:hypothetical protein